MLTEDYSLGQLRKNCRLPIDFLRLEDNVTPLNALVNSANNNPVDGDVLLQLNSDSPLRPCVSMIPRRRLSAST